MLCPTCNHQLLSLLLKTNTQDIGIDYCQNCGGVWTDPGEINFFNEKDLKPLLQVLPKNPPEPNGQNNFCPRDRALLEFFRGENVPVNLDVFSCPKCHGYWFPHKNLLKFKEAQNVKINYFKTWNIPLPSIYAVVLPVLAFVVIGGGILAAYQTITQTQDNRIQAKDFISKPLVILRDSGQVIISFTTQEAAITQLKYWTNEAEKTQIDISKQESTTHTIVLRDLEPNQTYYYQFLVTKPKSMTTEIFSFKTNK